MEKNYYEPLLNIIDNTLDLLDNFDEIKPTRYGMEKMEKSREYNVLINDDDSINNINNSFIIDLIENNVYKEYSDNIKPDINDIELHHIRNFSYSYKTHKLFFLK